MNTETKILLEEAISEVKQLRKDNELMRARLDVFDKMMLLFTSQPAYGSHGYAEDIVYKMEKHLEAYKKSS